MGAKLHESPERREHAAKPGPGNYSPANGFVRKSEPSFRIGTETRRDLAFEKAQTFQTSPGQYDPNTNATKLKAAGWRIGTEQRKGMVQPGQDKVPGAGQYAIPSRMSEGPKVHMHAKHETINKNHVPGPGQYDLVNSPGTRNMRAAAYSMGTSNRVDLANTKATKDMPGPGNYQTGSDLKRAGPRYGFGSQSRPEIGGAGKFQTPAPGTYN